MVEYYLSCCFTGYRPQKFPFPVDITNSDYLRFENSLTEQLNTLINEGCRTFYCGMAMGFDIIAAEAVLTLSTIYPSFDIKLIAVVPFIEQSASFSDEWLKRYNNVLAACDETVLISDNYYPACYMKRNYYMVDNSDFVLTFYSGKSGGTARTVKYAESKGRKVINLYRY